MLLTAYQTMASAQNTDDVDFNQDFLGDSGQSVTTSLDRFRQKNTLLPGIYLSDLYVNNKWIGRQDLVFQDSADGTNATVCFNSSLLQLFGIDFNLLPEASSQLLASDHSSVCYSIEQLIPDAQFHYEANALRADISIPQYYLLKNARGYIHPRFWDEGVPAATVGYQFNAYHYEAVGRQDTSYYLGLNTGVNVLGWRFRHQGVMTKSGHHDWRYQGIASYVKHDVTALHSQFLAGDAYTPSILFDSVGFRGVQLSSDDRMLPDSQVGYAPVIRGTAKTNAKVSVYQQGLLINETTVSPGAFEINDLYATGQSGDLQVVVAEANGEQYEYSVPNLSFSPLLREGAAKYYVTAGKTRDSGLEASASSLLQMEGGIGLNNSLTLYNGILFARHYRALAGSLAFSTAYGALALGFNHASAKVAQRRQHGYSLNMKYSHQLAATDTSLSLAAYHYFSPHYYALSDVLHDRVKENIQFPFDEKYREPVASAVGQQHQLQLSIAQYLGEKKGTLFLSGSFQQYWGSTQSVAQYLLGYSNSYDEIAYQVSLQRQKSLRKNKMMTQLAVSVSMPLGKKMNAPTMSINHYQSASTSTSVAVNGTLNKANTLSYGISATKHNNAYQAAVSTQYRAPYALLSGSYGHGDRYSQLSGNLSGGIVLHPGGITLAQGLGESIGIVEAKGAKGAKINTNGIAVDHFGYAVVPFLTPYRMNQIDIDPKGISFDTELTTTSQRVTPRAGAVVMLKYPTLTGRSALLISSLADQQDMPFGAEVFDEDHHYVGITGQGGHIFVRGLQHDQGVLTVKWGEGKDNTCQLPYQLPPEASHADDELLQAEAVCYRQPQDVTEQMMPAKP